MFLIYMRGLPSRGKSQYWLREILNKMYKNDINGLGGNDDCGQMSAWYLFSVMGLLSGLSWYRPVCIGSALPALSEDDAS